MSDQKTVKVEIEVPECPIPEGMKRGEPAYEIRVTKAGDWCLHNNLTWCRPSILNIGKADIVANFVPIEPEEPEFIDVEVDFSKAQFAVINLPKSLTDGVSDYLAVNISHARTHRYFSCFVWAAGIHFSDNAFYDGKRFCTHVRFRNPKYKKGE
jgi:hypothetical protein